MVVLLRRRITVTSSLNEISTDQLGNRVMVKGGWGGGGVGVNPAAYISLQQAFGQIFKDDVSGFPSSSDICFMSFTLPLSGVYFRFRL